MRTKLIYTFLISFFVSPYIKAQSDSDFLFFESRLQSLAEMALSGENDSMREESNKLLIEELEELLLLDGNYHYDFKNIDKINILPSSDKKFRLFNWVLPKMDGTFDYFAFLQFYNKRKKESHFYKLVDVSDSIDNPSYQMLNNGNWYGAFYFDIIHTKFQKKDYYTFLAWDGNNAQTTKKIIDVLHFDEENRPIFGAPIFKMNDGTHYRIILEYTSGASTTMNYREKDQTILYDHLVPLDGVEIGMYEFYVPSLSYDGLSFKNGKWRFIEDIPVFNNKRQDAKQSKRIQRGLQSQ